jgi:hypothetical protein
MNWSTYLTNRSTNAILRDIKAREEEFKKALKADAKFSDTKAIYLQLKKLKQELKEKENNSPIYLKDERAAELCIFRG